MILMRLVSLWPARNFRRQRSLLRFPRKSYSEGVCVCVSTLDLCVTACLNRLFTTEALEELERFHKQKVADFRSILINFIQLQMHMHRKVTKSMS